MHEIESENCLADDDDGLKQCWDLWGLCSD